ncbi:MAG: hypothetical protein WCB99_06860, partial [Candidatus Cybelea sp.]
MAFISVAFCDFGDAFRPPLGAEVGRTSIGRTGALLLRVPAPGRGPGEAPPLGPGLGARPAVLATAVVLVGLGLGTPA